MNSFGRGALIIGVGVSALAGLILFGSGGDEGSKESTLFKTNWDMIEYVPAADYYSLEEPTTDGTPVTPPSPKSEKLRQPPGSPGRMGASPNPSPAEETKGRLALKFIRRSGLFRDQFEVLTPFGGERGAREVRRRGSGAVRNIFATWGKLVVKGIYTQAEAGDPVRLGLSGGAPRVLLYESRSRSPVTVVLGRKMKNGQMFIKSDKDGESLYLVPAGEEFRNTYLSYRDRRVLSYPTKSYTARMSVKQGDRAVLLTQRRVEVKGTEQPEWQDSRGRIIPAQRANGLESALRQVNITRFPDEPDLRAYGDPEALWLRAGDPLLAEVSIHGGDVITIEYRLPSAPVSPGGHELVLLRNSLDGTVDFADRSQYDSLSRGLNDIIAEQKRLDTIEKMHPGGAKKESGSAAPRPSRPALPTRVPGRPRLPGPKR